MTTAASSARRPHLLALAALAGCLVSAVLLGRAPAWPQAFVAQPAPRCSGASFLTVSTMRAAAPDYAHAASALALGDGRLRAFWYEGTDELQDDVSIRTAVFDGKAWSAPSVVIGAAGTAAAEGLYVSKIGNAVAFRRADGDLVLTYVTIGFGGWSGASLNLMRSRDEGATWSPPRRLVTTATLNFSTLVRSPAIPMAGGYTLLPTYQEFLVRLPELLLLDPQDRVVARRRLPGSGAIQPTLAVLDATRAIAFNRTRGPGRVPLNVTADAGASWQPGQDAALGAYDKPIAVLPLGGGKLLGAYNVGVAGWPISYGPLAIGVSEDAGLTWRTLHTLQYAPGEAADAHYPWLVTGADGVIHLLYTRTLPQGSTLQHVRFTRDWVAEQGNLPCP